MVRLTVIELQRKVQGPPPCMLPPLREDTGGWELSRFPPLREGTRAEFSTAPLSPDFVEVRHRLLKTRKFSADPTSSFLLLPLPGAASVLDAKRF